jgi:hypothetical protein
VCLAPIRFPNFQGLLEDLPHDLIPREHPDRTAPIAGPRSVRQTCFQFGYLLFQGRHPVF